MRAPLPALFDPDALARRFRALADPLRLQLLGLLYEQGELNVQELVEATGQRQANISKHLAVLRDAGFVARRPDGAQAFYRLYDPAVTTLLRLAAPGPPDV